LYVLLYRKKTSNLKGNKKMVYEIIVSKNKNKFTK